MSVHHVAIQEQATGNLVSAELDNALPADALFALGRWERPARR